MTVTYTTDGGLVGMSFLSAAEGGSGGLDGGFGGGGGLPSFGRTLLAELTSSLILDEGTGGPTWSRATKAWGFNELGYLEEIASGCAVFGGARLVRNTVRTKSEDFSNAAWTKSNLTVTGTNGIVCANSTSPQFIYQSSSGTSIVAGQVLLCCARLKYVSGGADFVQIAPDSSGFGTGQYATISLLDGSTNVVGCTATATLVAADTYDFCVRLTATATGAFETWNVCFAGSLAAGRIPNFVGDGIKSFELLRAWSVDVTNYDASYVPEYVSVGVLLNTVRTTSEDFSNAAWIKTNLTVTGTNILVCSNSTADNSVNQATDTSVPTIAGQYFRYSIRAKRVAGGVSFVQIGGSSTSFGATAFCTFSLIDGTYSAQTGVTVSVTQISSDTYDFSVRLLCTTTTPGSDVFYVSMQNGLSDTRKQLFVGDGVKSFQLLRAWSVNVSQFDASYVPPYYAVGVGTNVYFGAGIDGAKYFETDWQGAPIAAASLLGLRREAAAMNNLLHSRDMSNAAWSTKTNIAAAKTTTGLDGIANTATTLTAGAADAIILQPISLTSAARCASAYVKRRTGTGTISFTQDGGSTWTDITAQINSSTWSRVQITSTLANPSVGFKIGTSGDAIDVDCVQNEAGTAATSPIVTTTATLTRNADSLTYQTASNWSDTAGTAYIEVQPLSWVAGGAIGSATNGLLLSAANSGATASDGTNTANGPAGSPSGREKLAMRWGGGAMTVASGGVVGTAGTYDGGMGIASVGIAINSSTYCGPVAIYNYQMTDAELQAITS